MTDCLDDLDAAAFVAGTLVEARFSTLILHVDACTNCHALIEELCAARAHHDDVLPGFRIAGILGVGGMGVVYRAFDIARGVDCAVKVPRTASPWIVRRFEREVEITSRFDHPSIPAVHAAGRLADGRPYFAMPLVDGISLDSALARATNRTERLRYLHHLLGVADALAHAHARGIAHRDLKPQNVLVTRDGNAIVIDWGLAKDLHGAPALPPASVHALDLQLPTGRTTRPGDVLGTPAFMAPEQARGEPVDERSDVYTLGAMVEHVLTDRLPRKAADAALALAPPPLVAVVQRAMAPEPGDRFRHAGELVVALRSALEAA